MSDIGHLGALKAMDLLRKKLRMDIYVPLVDEGVGFVAVRQDSFYRTQVKTSMFQRNSYFWFDLCKNRIIYSENTIYSFVCTTQRAPVHGSNTELLGDPFSRIAEMDRQRRHSIEGGE